MNTHLTPKYIFLFASLICLGACSSLQHLANQLFRSTQYSQSSQSQVLTSVPFLQRRVRMIFPGEIRTVGEAVDYLLAPYDFQSVALDETSSNIAIYEYIPTQDVSAVPLFVAIKRLMGEEYKIVFDSEEQLYAFQYKRLGDNPIVFHDLSLLDVFTNSDIQSSGPFIGQGLRTASNQGYSTVSSTFAQKNAERLSFKVQRGSLRENAIRLTHEAHWQTDASEWFIPYDYTVKSAFTIHYYSLDEAMTQLLKPYQIAAIFLDADRKIVFEEM